MEHSAGSSANSHAIVAKASFIYVPRAHLRIKNFATPLSFQVLWFKNGAKNQKPKTIVFRKMSGLSSATDSLQLGPPTLRSICQMEPPKCDNWENGYITVTPRKLRNCQNSLRVESKMVDDAKIFTIQTPISLE